MNRRHFLSAAGVLSLAGCSSPGIEQFRAETPLLDLRQYFDGVVDAWGVVRNRDGSISQRFTVEIQASWETREHWTRLSATPTGAPSGGCGL